MKFIFLNIFLALIVSVLALTGCIGPANESNQDAVEAVTGVGAVSTGAAAKKDLAIAQCQILFQQKFAAGADLSAGPCLSEQIIADWSCDLVQSPRTSADDRPENQCASVRNGQTNHYVELDQSGQLLKAE
jgi:hypothetical protein